MSGSFDSFDDLDINTRGKSMQKIQRVSKFFKWLFQIMCIALPILLVIFWVNAPSPIELVRHASIINYIPESIKIFHTLSSSEKFFGFLIALMPLAVNIFILCFLIRLFQLYEKCEIFSLKNVQYIKYIGYTLLIGQFIVNPIDEAILSATLTWRNPHGERMAVISFTGTNLGIVLTALLIILISWIMAEGHKINEDRKYTI